MSRKKHILSRLFTLKTKKSQAGFTLLELLISIVIVSIILTLMFGALRLGIRVWDKGGKDSDQMHRIRIVKNHMKRQIASICTQKILNSKSQVKPVALILKGTDNSMTFLSDYSISPDIEKTPVYVTYSVTDSDTRDLVLFETAVDTLNYKELLEIDQEDKTLVLLKDVHDIRFEYLKKNLDGTMDWQDSWNNDLKQTTSFPAAVKLGFEAGKTQVTLLVKIMSEYEDK